YRHCSSPLKHRLSPSKGPLRPLVRSSLRPPFSPVLRTRTTKETTAVCFGSRHPAQFHGRSAVNISSVANGALGEHRRQDNDGMSPEIAPPGCRSSVRRSSEPYW